MALAPIPMPITPGLLGQATPVYYDATGQWQWDPYAVGGATRPDSFTGMQPDFNAALEQMFANAPPEIRDSLQVSSGYRSVERQQQLWEEALAKYGSAEEARRWVAPPGNSQHNHGNAADLRYLSPEARDWAHANAAQYNLSFPLGNEDWHIELASARGGQGAPTSMPQQGQQMAATPQQGLLGTVSTSGAPERQPGIFDALLGKLPAPVASRLGSADWRDNMTLALAGMSMNPNQALIGGVQRRMDSRDEERRINQTVQWLQSMGRTDLAEAVASGAIGADAAASVAIAPPAQPEQTSLMQNYDFLIQQGYTPEQALAAVQSGTVVNVGGTEQPMTGTISPGYARVPDPTNPSGFRDIPIPGGVEDNTATATATDNARTVATDTITTAAQRARDAAGSRALTGPLGVAASYLPMTDNAEIYRQVDVLKAQAAAENLNAMRQQSPTGGALGNVTEGELKLLQDKSGALDPQSPNFQRDLDDYELTLLKTVHGPVEGQRIFDATRPVPKVETTTLPPNANDLNAAGIGTGSNRVLTYDPETGTFK